MKRKKAICFEQRFVALHSATRRLFMLLGDEWVELIAARAYTPETNGDDSGHYLLVFLELDGDVSHVLSCVVCSAESYASAVM